MTRSTLFALVTTGLVSVGCAGSESKGTRDSAAASPSPASAASAGADLTGAGATFPQPIYSKWFSDYAAKTGVKINYQSIGSGGGIRQIQEGTVDFGASDAPMTDDEMAKAKGGPIFHFPTVLGADVITYNVPGVTQSLQLTGDVVADIFLGKITKWNDARIAGLNQGVKLPASDILVVHRSDGSGTTYVFTDYLTAVSPAWASGPGKAKDVKWPVGLGGKGNEGVTQQVKQSEGAIGYVELIYAISNGLPYATLKNAAGQYVEASLKSVTAAASAADLKPDTDFRVSITNAAGAEAYPIASFTWLLVQKTPRDSAKGEEIRKFLVWMLQPEAQRMTSAMGSASAISLLIAE